MLEPDGGPLVIPDVPDVGYTPVTPIWFTTGILDEAGRGLAGHRARPNPEPYGPAILTVPARWPGSARQPRQPRRTHPARTGLARVAPLIRRTDSLAFRRSRASKQI
jgi:hypothetical protein